MLQNLRHLHVLAAGIRDTNMYSFPRLLVQFSIEIRMPIPTSVPWNTISVSSKLNILWQCTMSWLYSFFLETNAVRNTLHVENVAVTHGSRRIIIRSYLLQRTHSIINLTHADVVGFEAWTLLFFDKILRLKSKNIKIIGFSSPVHLISITYPKGSRSGYRSFEKPKIKELSF